MTSRITCVLAAGFLTATAGAVQASSSSQWSELYQRASAACVKASELKKAVSGKPVDFSDKVLVMVDGIWPQAHMKNAPARFACLYDKKAKTAEAAEAAR